MRLEDEYSATQLEMMKEGCEKLEIVGKLRIRKAVLG